MRSILGTLFVASGLLMPVQAEEAGNTLNRIDTKVDKILENTEELKSIATKSPLGKKKYGAEFNFLRLIAIDSDEATLSGGVSYFDHGNKVEWSLPAYVGVTDDDYGSNTYVANLDLHYRKFLGPSVNGFYLSGFGRATYIHGTEEQFLDSLFEEPERKRSSEVKLGIGVGIGYRVFSRDNLYWGTSLNVGRYLVGESGKYFSAGVDDFEYIFDVELLKFGYAF